MLILQVSPPLYYLPMVQPQQRPQRKQQPYLQKPQMLLHFSQGAFHHVWRCLFLHVKARDVYWLTQGSNASTPTSSRQDAHTPDWTVAEAQEFVPQGFEAPPMVRLTLPFLLLYGVPFSGKNLGGLGKAAFNPWETFFSTHAQQLNQFVRHLSRVMVTVALRPLGRLILL